MHAPSTRLVARLLRTGACLGGVVLARAAADPAERAPSVWPPRGTLVKVMINRDTWVSEVGRETRGNNGGASKFKLKGIQEYTLLDADLAALKGRIVTGALLHMRSASPDAPARRVSISTVATPWVEGTGQGYAEQNGSACFVSPELGVRDWAFPGSTLLDAAWGRGHTVWRFADATLPEEGGWQAVAVEPSVVAANLAGLSHGFAVMDDVGTEWSVKGGVFKQKVYANRFFDSRHQHGGEPWLQVWVDGEDHQAPQAIQGVVVRTLGLPAGQALVKWNTPDDPGGGRVLGFHVTGTSNGQPVPIPRYLIPMAGRPGAEVRMLLQDLGLKPGQALKLAISAVDFAGNVGAPYTVDVRVSAQPETFTIAPNAIQPFEPSETLPEVDGLKVSVVDLLDKIEARTGRMVPPHPPGYRGGNHLWSAARQRIRLQAARNETVAFQINLEGRSDAVRFSLAFPSAAGIKTSLFRFDDVLTDAGTMPDALVPLDGAVAVPALDDPQAAWTANASFLGEIYVPHDAKPGVTSGTLTLSSGKHKLDLDVELTVWDFMLPDKLAFIPEMNCYGTAAPTGAGLAYYRLAHEHRTCLNRLYYGWNGQVSDGAAPEQTAGGFDWTRFDREFGPLFDGSAFAGLPRGGVPVDVWYLPLNEDWPVKLAPHYHPSYWADEAFDPGYRQAFRAACAAFARHGDERQWHSTAFEFYLNNKVYYRQGRSLATTPAPWVFDEPANIQDFWALRWYGLLFRQGVDPNRGQARMWFRADVSRTQYDRNMLWGVLDLEVMGGVTGEKIRMKQDERALWGRNPYTEYGSANDPKDANTQPAVWSLLAWSRGCIGVLPWQVIGEKGCWDKGQSTCLFYPSDKGPAPSVRLKAFTRGEEDVEYLTLLAETCGQPRAAIVAGMRQVVNLAGSAVEARAGDAGTLRFEQADPRALWELRTRVAAMIAARRPPRARAVPMPPIAAVDLAQLPDVGYVTVAPVVASVPPEF